ncbi:hypothetical protein BGZ76_005942 [Entomortierella beljakovae]|nr:hypothetical protein BGZ76_005942 [Entomortierella beljakovae]
MQFEDIGVSLENMLPYDSDSIYQDNQITSPSMSTDSQEDGNFIPHNINFDIGNLPSPCSPTFDSFQVDSSDLDAKVLVRPCPKPLELNSSNFDAFMDSAPMTAMSMVTSESPSPTRSSSPSPSAPSELSEPSYDDTIAPVVACANCKRSHIKCDHGRPCQNCLKNPSKANNCRDAVPKPRGRPKGGSKSSTDPMALRLPQIPGYQPFSGSSYLLQGERPTSQSYGHLIHEPQDSMYYQHEPSIEYQSIWGSNAPGVPEMQSIATPSGPQAPSQMVSAVNYNTQMSPYDIQRLQQHRQQVQQMQSQGPSNPHDVGMKRSMSDHYGPHRSSVQHFHSEHHKIYHMQQQQQQQQQHQRHRPHNIFIPSAGDVRLVGSPVSPSFPTSLPPTPISPVHPMHASAQSYHHQYLSQAPLSPMAHGPMSGPHEDASNPAMAMLLQQEQEIKHSLEMYEQKNLQKQQELAQINLQKLKLQISQLKQLEMALEQEHQQSRILYRRRSCTQLGISMPPSSSSLPLAPVHDEEMSDMDV